MSFFSLQQYVDIQRLASTTDRAGQSNNTYTTLYAATPCLFYALNGNRNTNTLIEFNQTSDIYFSPDTDIHENDQLVNIIAADGTAMEGGPYLVVFVRKVIGFGGKVHHITCKVRG